MVRGPRIAIDFYETKYRASGLGEYSWALATEISARSQELKQKYNITLYFLVSADCVGAFGNGVKYINVDSFSRFTRVALRIFPRRYDIYHRVHQFSKTRRLLFALKNILTIHDINFIHDSTEPRFLKYFCRTQRFIDNADSIVVISNFVESDLRAHFKVNTPVTVIHNGVSDHSSLADVDDRGYLFHLSSLMPKKNVDLLVRMMEYLPEYRLVVAGGVGNYGESLSELAHELKLNNVTFLGQVDAKSKAELLCQCSAFVFPSLCEGFGLPPLEAMCIGKPVFLSNLTSLPEVGGEYAYYWNELVPEKMAETVRNKLQNPEYNSQQIQNWARQFKWSKTADKYIELYKSILNNSLHLT